MKEKHLTTILINAIVSRDNTKFVSLLQEKEPDVYLNMRTNTGNTLLHIASISGNTEAFIFLKIRGADLQATNNRKASVLHYAALGGNIVILTSLIVEGANPNAEDEDGKSVLHCAIMGGNITVIIFLVKKKETNVNSKDKKGNTPLHLAAANSHEKIVKLLLKKGALVNYRNKEGATPLDIAIKHGEKKVIKVLKDKISSDYRKKIVFCLSTPIIFILSSIAFLNIIVDIHSMSIMYIAITIIAVSVITSIIIFILNSCAYKADYKTLFTGEVSIKNHTSSTPITSL